MTLKPGTPKFWLHLTAGLMWSGVGLWLCYLAYGWLQPEDKTTALIMAAIGIILALTIYRFGFSKFADRNINRIQNIASERPCIFAFQSWSSYPLVAFMISLGIFLREHFPHPKTLSGCHVHWHRRQSVSGQLSLLSHNTGYIKTRVKLRK